MQQRTSCEIKEPLNKCGFGALWSFYAGSALLKLEKVFLGFRACFDAKSLANRVRRFRPCLKNAKALSQGIFSRQDFVDFP